jgi:hypothetical protein
MLPAVKGVLIGNRLIPMRLRLIQFWQLNGCGFDHGFPGWPDDHGKGARQPDGMKKANQIF